MKQTIMNTAMLPLKALKMLMEMMRTMVSAVMRMFGLGGLAPAHTAATPTPGNALSQEEIKAEKGKGLEPSLELAKRFVPDQVLDSVIAFAKATAEERKKLDVSKMSPTMKTWLATLNADKLKALGDMDREKARIETFNGIKAMKARQSKMTRPNKALAAVEPSLMERSAAEGKALKTKSKIDEEKLAERVRNRKKRASPSPALAFGM